MTRHAALFSLALVALTTPSSARGPQVASASVRSFHLEVMHVPQVARIAESELAT